MTKFRNAAHDGTAAWKELLTNFVAKQLSRTHFTRRMTQTLGQYTEFAQWQIDHFSEKLPLCVKREQVWKKMLGSVDTNKQVVVWEFGVAYGYATNWWLSRISSQRLSWHGFDRFTGLPRAWRTYSAGAFDAGGVPPPHFRQ
jgi:hypothetical protein